MKCALVLAALLLGGCAAVDGGAVDGDAVDGSVDVPAAEVAAVDSAPGADVAVLQRVPFVVGTSSHTVEQLAKAQACTSERGAGLVTEQGPVEVYRVLCENGSVFMARCELRECKQM